MAKSSQVRLAVLGAGKMGGILIEALVKQGLVSPKNLFATVAHAGRAAEEFCVEASRWGRTIARPRGRRT